MTHALIEFLAADPSQFPAPYPAARGVPQWLKDMPGDRPLQSADGARQVPTIKRCPPFLEATACGYLIPAPAEVVFTRETSGAVRFDADANFVDTQHPLQVHGSPLQGQLIVKFASPWVVKTPPGFSTLFLQPLNQFDLPFQLLPGLVETDTYYRPVSFPTVCVMRPGTTYTLKRGTPIAQAIPLKREEWQSRAAAWDAAARDEVEREMRDAREDFYKDRHWKKKRYG